MSLNNPPRLASALHHGELARPVIATLLFAACVGVLAGCDRAPGAVARNASYAAASGPPLPLPNPALLTQSAAPQCEFDSGADPAADERTKLDYERQCYRHAEIIARYRLLLLQNAVRRTIAAVRQRERDDVSDGRLGGYTFVQQVSRQGL